MSSRGPGQGSSPRATLYGSTCRNTKSSGRHDNHTNLGLGKESKSHCKCRQTADTCDASLILCESSPRGLPPCREGCHQYYSFAKNINLWRQSFAMRRKDISIIGANHNSTCFRLGEVFLLYVRNLRILARLVSLCKLTMYQRTA